MPLRDILYKPTNESYEKLAADKIPYSIQPKNGIQIFDPSMSNDNVNRPDWRNSAGNNIRTIKGDTLLGSALNDNQKLDTNKAELYKLQDAFSLTDNPNEKKVLSDRIVMLNNENSDLQSKIDDINGQVAELNYKKKQHPVSVPFQLKSDFLQSQENSSVKDWISNESAQDLSSSYSYLWEMGAAMVAPTLIKRFVPKMLKFVGFEALGAAEDLTGIGVPAGVVTAGIGASELVSAITLLSEVTASAGLMWDMRKKETYSEMQDNFQSRLNDMVDAFKKTNNTTTISDRDMTQLRLNAYKGLDELEAKNNALFFGDVLELLPLAMPWGGLFESMGELSRTGKALKTLGSIGLVSYSEGVEEGLQWKYGYDYKHGLYDSKAYHPGLYHGLFGGKGEIFGGKISVDDFIKDRVDVNGGIFLNYKPTIFDNADFRNNVRAGALGGLVMSGVSGIFSTAYDQYKYNKVKNTLNAFKGQMDIEDADFQSKILSKFLTTGKKNFLIWALDSYKNNVTGVDKEKIDMLKTSINELGEEFEKVTGETKKVFGFFEKPNLIHPYLTAKDRTLILNDILKLKLLEHAQNKKINDFVSQPRQENQGLLSQFQDLDSIPEQEPDLLTDEINEVKNRLKDRMSVKYYQAREKVWKSYKTAVDTKDISKQEELKYYYSHLLSEHPDNTSNIQYNSEATYVRNAKVTFGIRERLHREAAYDIVQMADKGATLDEILRHIVKNDHPLTKELVDHLSSLISQAKSRGEVFDKDKIISGIDKKIRDVEEEHRNHVNDIINRYNQDPDSVSAEELDSVTEGGQPSAKMNELAEKHANLHQQRDYISAKTNVDEHTVNVFGRIKNDLLFRTPSNLDSSLKEEFGRKNYMQGSKLVQAAFDNNDDYTDGASVSDAIDKAQKLLDILYKHKDKDNGYFKNYIEDIKYQLERLNEIKAEVTKRLGDKLRKEEAVLKENNKSNWESLGINIDDATVTNSDLYSKINEAVDGILDDILEQLKTDEGKANSHWLYLKLKDRLVNGDNHEEVRKYADEQISNIITALSQLPTVIRGIDLFSNSRFFKEFIADPIHFLNHSNNVLGITEKSVMEFKKSRVMEDLRKANEGSQLAKDFLDLFEKLIIYRNLKENVSEDNTFSLKTLVDNLTAVVKDSPAFYPSPTQFLAICQFFDALNVTDKTNNLFSNFTYLSGIAGTGKTNIVLKWVYKLMNMDKTNTYALAKYEKQSGVLSKSLEFDTKNDFETFFKDLVDKKDDFESGKIKYIIFDEVGLLSDDDLLRFSTAIQELNKRRTTPIKVLLLGDPEQLTENGQFGSAIDEAYIPGDNKVVGIRRLNPLNIIYRSNVSSLNTIADIFRNTKSRITNLIAPYDRTTKHGVQGSHDIEDIFRVIEGRDVKKKKIIICSNENIKIVQDTVSKLSDEMKANITVDTVKNAQSDTVEEVYIALDNKSKNYNRQMYVATSRATEYVFIVDKDIRFESIEAQDDGIIKKTNDENFKKYRQNMKDLVNMWGKNLGNKEEAIPKKSEEEKKDEEEAEEKKDTTTEEPKPEETPQEPQLETKPEEVPPIEEEDKDPIDEDENDNFTEENNDDEDIDNTEHNPYDVVETENVDLQDTEVTDGDQTEETLTKLAKIKALIAEISEKVKNFFTHNVLYIEHQSINAQVNPDDIKITYGGRRIIKYSPSKVNVYDRVHYIKYKYKGDKIGYAIVKKVSDDPYDNNFVLLGTLSNNEINDSTPFTEHLKSSDKLSSFTTVDWKDDVKRNGAIVQLDDFNPVVEGYVKGITRQNFAYGKEWRKLSDDGISTIIKNLKEKAFPGKEIIHQSYQFRIFGAFSDAKKKNYQYEGYTIPENIRVMLRTGVPYLIIKIHPKGQTEPKFFAIPMKTQKLNSNSNKFFSMMKTYIDNCRRLEELSGGVCKYGTKNFYNLVYDVNKSDNIDNGISTKYGVDLSTEKKKGEIIKLCKDISDAFHKRQAIAKHSTISITDAEDKVIESDNFLSGFSVKTKDNKKVTVPFAKRLRVTALFHNSIELNEDSTEQPDEIEVSGKDGKRRISLTDGKYKFKTGFEHGELQAAFNNVAHSNRKIIVDNGKPKFLRRRLVIKKKEGEVVITTGKSILPTSTHGQPLTLDVLEKLISTNSKGESNAKLGLVETGLRDNVRVSLRPSKDNSEVGQINTSDAENLETNFSHYTGNSMKIDAYVPGQTKENTTQLVSKSNENKVFKLIKTLTEKLKDKINIHQPVSNIDIRREIGSGALLEYLTDKLGSDSYEILSYLSQKYGLVGIDGVREFIKGIRNSFLTDEQIKALYLHEDKISMIRIEQGTSVNNLLNKTQDDVKKDDDKKPPPPPSGDDNSSEEDPSDTSNIDYDDSKDDNNDPPLLSLTRSKIAKNGKLLSIEKLREYARKILPGITDEELEFLDSTLGHIVVNGKQSVGAFSKGIIKLLKEGNFSYKGWLRHEMLHKIFREYLTVAERTKLYSDASIYFGKKYATWSEIEEDIGEDFQNIDTSTILGWLKDKINRLLAFFNSHRRDMYKIYDMIEKGEFGERERDTHTFYHDAPLVDVEKSFGGKNNIFKMAQESTLKIFTLMKSNFNSKGELSVGKNSFKSDDEIITEISKSFLRFKRMWDFDKNKPRETYIAITKDSNDKEVTEELPLKQGDKDVLEKFYRTYFQTMSVNLVTKEITYKDIYRKDDFIEIINGLSSRRNVVEQVLADIFPDAKLTEDDEERVDDTVVNLKAETLDRESFNHMLNANKLIKYFLSTVFSKNKKGEVFLLSYGRVYGNCLRLFKTFDYTTLENNASDAIAEIKRVFANSQTEVEIGKHITKLVESANEASMIDHNGKTVTSSKRIHFFNKTSFVIDLRKDTSTPLYLLLTNNIKSGKLADHEIYVFNNDTNTTLNNETFKVKEHFNSEFIKKVIVFINNTMTEEQRNTFGGYLNMPQMALSLVKSENKQILTSLVSTFSSLIERNYYYAESKVTEYPATEHTYRQASDVAGNLTGKTVMKAALKMLLNNEISKSTFLNFKDNTPQLIHRVLHLLNLPVKIDLNRISDEQRKNIEKGIMYVINAINTQKVTTDFDDIIDNQNSFAKLLGAIIDDELGHDTNTSIRTAGKTKYKYGESSFGRDVLEAIVSGNTKLFPFLKSTFYSKYNILLNGIKDLVIIDHDHLKAYLNRVISYLDENKKQFFEREFLHGFHYFLSKGKFVLFMNPISNRPNILGIQTSILKEKECTNAILKAIQQHHDFVHDKTRRQVKSVDENIKDNDFSLFRGFKTTLDFSNRQLSFNEMTKAADEFYAELVSNANKFKGEVTDLFMKDNDFEKLNKDTINEHFENFYINHTIQTYFLNQLVAGNEMFFKHGRPEFDFIKRLAGVFAPGTKGFISELFRGGRPEFRVAVIKDINKEIVDNIFKNSPIFKTLVNISDAQGFMSERRHNELVAMLGENYNVTNIVKPVFYNIDKNGVPIYGKYSAIVLTKDLVDAFPELKKYDDMMKTAGKDGLGVDELLFESAVKVGCPKTLTQWEDEVIHPDSIVTVSNYNYRIQQNPHHEVDSKTSLPSQIIHFLNSNFLGKDNVFFEKTMNVYNAISALQMIGFTKFLKNFDIDQENKANITTWRRRAIEAIKNLPGSEGLIQLLKSNMTIDAKALSNRLIISFMSNFEKTSVKITLPGDKLVLQSQVGIQIYRTKDGIKLYDKLTEEEKKTLQGTELQYKTDANGNVLYAECIAPRSWRNQVEIGDIIMNTMVGFRIPSSNLHSAVPIRIVGFYPTDNNIIITPKEITTIHGSDFDVDSLFILRRSTFNHDLKIGDKQHSAKDVVGMDSENNFDFSDTFIKEVTAEISKVKETITNNEIKDKNIDNKELKTQLAALYEAEENYHKNVIFQGILDIISSVEARSDMFTPISFDLFRTDNKSGNHIVDVLGEDLTESDRKAFVTKLENLVNDYKQYLTDIKEDSTLTSEEFINQKNDFTDVEKKLYALLTERNYTTKDNQVKPVPVLTQIQILQGSKLERRNINTPEGKQLMHEDNASGAKLTGIFAKAMSIFNYLNFAAKIEGKPASGISTPFEFLGTTYQNFGLREKLKNDKEGGKVLETQDALVNAAIDNVKEGILALINATKLTSNILPLLVNLGMPIDEIIMFIKQPVISKTQLKFNYNNIAETLKKLKNLMESKDVIVDENYTSISFSKLDLLNGLANNKKLEDMTADELEVQYAILSKFKDIYTTSKDLFQVGNIISNIQRTPVTPEDISKNSENIDSYKDKTNIDDGEEVNEENNFQSNVLSVPHIKNSIEQFTKAHRVIKNSISAFSDYFSDMVNKLTDRFGTSPYSIFEDREKLRNSFVQFLMSNRLYSEFQDEKFTYHNGKDEITVYGSEAFNLKVGSEIQRIKNFFMQSDSVTGINNESTKEDIRKFLNSFISDLQTSNKSRFVKIGYKFSRIRMFDIKFRDTKNINPIERSSIYAGGEALLNYKSKDGTVDGKEFLLYLFKYLLLSSDLTQGRFKYTEFLPSSIINQIDYTSFMENKHKELINDKDMFENVGNWFLEQYVCRNAETLPTVKQAFKEKNFGYKWSGNFKLEVTSKIPNPSFPKFIINANSSQKDIYMLATKLETPSKVVADENEQPSDSQPQIPTTNSIHATYVWIGVPNYSGVYQANDKMFKNTETKYDYQKQVWVMNNVDEVINKVYAKVDEEDTKFNFKVGDMAIFRNIDDFFGTKIVKMSLTKIEDKTIGTDDKLKVLPYKELTYEKGMFLKDDKFYKATDLDAGLTKLDYTPEEKNNILKDFC